MNGPMALKLGEDKMAVVKIVDDDSEKVDVKTNVENLQKQRILEETPDSLVYVRYPSGEVEGTFDETVFVELLSDLVMLLSETYNIQPHTLLQAVESDVVDETLFD